MVDNMLSTQICGPEFRSPNPCKRKSQMAVVDLLQAQNPEKETRNPWSRLVGQTSQIRSPGFSEETLPQGEEYPRHQTSPSALRKAHVYKFAHITDTKTLEGMLHIIFR